MSGLDNATIKRIATLEHKVQDLELERNASRSNIENLFNKFQKLKDTLQDFQTEITTNDMVYRITQDIEEAYCADCSTWDPILNRSCKICENHNCKYGNSITREQT